MILLAANNTIAAGASHSNRVTCTIFGMELAGTSESYKIIDQRQLLNTPMVIYTSHQGITTFIETITLVNTHSTDDCSVKFYINGLTNSHAISAELIIPAGGYAMYSNKNGWTITTIEPGTTLHNDIHTGYSEYQAISTPNAPSSNNIRLYARSVSGRVMPKWMPETGMDTFVQPSLFEKNCIVYLPNTGTTPGLSYGTPWVVGTTVSHPTPSAGIWNQVRRTASTNVVTTTNQLLGISAIATGAHNCWRGNAPGLGGFFFFARFAIETLTASSPVATRLFVGLQSGTTSILASDTIPAIGCIGLWHDTTDADGVLNIITRDGVQAASKVPLAGSPITPYTTGQAYDFYLYAPPNSSSIIYRLVNFNTNQLLSEGNIINNLPPQGTFMGPVVGMSNGTANIVAGTVGISVNKIYIETER